MFPSHDQEGGTYVFDWSDSTAQGHPIRFSLTANGTHGGGSEYTTGVVKDDSAYKTTITVASGVATLYYYCQYHSGMGGQINTNTTFGSTNFDGNALSIVQTNATAGFSIFTWTGGSNVQTHTFGHGLGVKPAMVIHKRRGSTSDWSVWHQGIPTPNDNFITLNNQNATSASPSWEQPTTSVLQPYIGSTGDTWVSYVFAEIEGYSKFGSFKGNGSSDGTFVFTGFRPAWILIKSSSHGS